MLSQDLGFGFGWSGVSVGGLKVYGTIIHVIGASGQGEVYTCPSGSGTCTGNADSAITLTRDAAGYTLTRRDGAREQYDAVGLLLSKTDAAGLTTVYAYTSGQLTQITGPYGHTQNFTYNGNHIASVTDASGVYQYAYDANNNLTGVTYPDGSGKRYHYENTAFPHYLTGVSYVETSGAVTRYANYGYDTAGKAVLTELAGGAERFTLSYDSDTQTTVRDAVLNAEVLTFSSNLGIKNLVSKANGSDGKSLVQTFDANNNLTCKKDEEGRVVTYTYNATNQRVSQTEGLVGSCSSPQTTSATRTTTYSYVSPTLDAPTVIEAPSVYAGSVKRTTLVYGDARFPTLPTSITQSGFTPSGTAISRAVTLAYNASGQVTSINGPRTDVNDITTLAYYSCTTGGACGQLASVTNALGHTTTYDSYDGAGRLLQRTDPNGLRTNYGYDARGRVTAITQTPPGGSGRTTSYAYNTAGNVTFTGMPDGRTLTYTYNAAQQLMAIVDNAGNRVSYSYDLKGNRTGEFTYDPDGTLVRSIATAFDARNHVEQLNRGGSVTQQVVDAIGNLTRTTDPNQVASGSGVSTTHSYDALSRLIQTLDTLNGSTRYGYNAHDKLTQVSAPNGAVTQYVYDDLGNLLQETSPDRGTTTYTYDAAGNVTSQTDARGITVNYTYDALNRIVGIDYPTDTDTVFTYDAGEHCTAGLGRLCQVIDASGTTHYGYDAFGNVTVQVKTELGHTYTTHYSYDSGDRVTSITYPDNRVVSYSRDNVGRITTVTATVNGISTPIATGRTYRADGLLLTQTYGNGLNEARSYDTQGRLTYQSLGTADTRVYSYDGNGNLTQKQALAEVGSYGYDALDRLVSEASATLTGSFGYDPNGNRLSASFNTLTTTLGYASGSNRLTQVSAYGQTLPVALDASGNTVGLPSLALALAYDEAGRLTAIERSGSVIARYVYNAHGQRTRKVVGTQTIVYHYDLAGNLIAETQANGTPIRAYVQTDDTPLAQLDRVIVKKTPTDRLMYLHGDHLHTPRLATDTDRRVVWRWEGEAFGALPPQTDPDGDGKKITVNLRFAGQYADAETGLIYNWNRYYDPRTGRYLSADPMSVAQHTQTMLDRLRRSGLQGKHLKYASEGLLRARVESGAMIGPTQSAPYELNPYAYVANNPLRWTDPTGESAAGGVCGALGIPASVCTGAGAAGSAVGAALGLGAGLMAFSPDAGCDDEEEEDCVEQWRRAYELCADEMKRGGGRGITGGHRDEYQCAKGLVSQKCGGNKVQ